MIQRKWFWIEHLPDGGIGRTGESETKGRNGSVIRYYEAVDLADACAQAQQWWARKKQTNAEFSARRRKERFARGLCESCGQRPIEQSKTQKNRWGGLSVRHHKVAKKCRECMDRTAELSLERRRGLRPANHPDANTAYAKALEWRERAAAKAIAKAGSSTGIVYLRMLTKFDELGAVAFRAWLVSKIPAMSETGDPAQPMAQAAE